MKLTVQSVLQGTRLRNFLTLYEKGVRGVPLANIMRRWEGWGEFKQDEIWTIYRKYAEVAKSGRDFASMSSGELQRLENIPIMSKLKADDLVDDRFNYFVKVRARVDGEESVHERIVQITNPQQLSQGDISNFLAPEFAKLVYTEKGDLAANAGKAIIFVEVEFIGAARLF